MIRSLWIIFLFLSSCGIKEDGERLQQEANPPEAFFPVTSFIKGEINTIRQSAVNPLMIVSTSGKEDSTWLKMEDLETIFKPFLTPVIDSATPGNIFKEEKFLDQTINAYTFSYDPQKELPEDYPLLRWDVYVDPANGTVTRIYMLKRIADGTQQLTWQSRQGCRIVNIKEKDGKPFVEKETEIQWNF